MKPAPVGPPLRRVDLKRRCRKIVRAFDRRDLHALGLASASEYRNAAAAAARARKGGGS